VKTLDMLLMLGGASCFAGLAFRGMSQEVFPIALITLNLCAAAVYANAGDLRRGVYWIAAAALTATVTF
jgi:hypothetical protein